MSLYRYRFYAESMPVVATSVPDTEVAGMTNDKLAGLMREIDEANKVAFPSHCATHSMIAKLAKMIIALGERQHPVCCRCNENPAQFCFDCDGEQEGMIEVRRSNDRMGR